MAFPKGQKNPNAGRRAGSQNQVTLEIKEAFKNLIELNTPNMISWMERVAEDDPAKALSLCADLAEFVVPKLARSELTGLEGKDLIPQEITLKAVKADNGVATS